MGEWDKPYLTMNYPYEATIVREFGKFALNGSLLRSKKPIYWCISCKTALAEAEVEYDEHRSPSIFVKFPMISGLDKLGPSLKGKQVSILIWTTTPWTLPANLAVALHPDLEYDLVQIGDSFYILAKDLTEVCAAKFGWTEWKAVATVPGQPP